MFIPEEGVRRKEEGEMYIREENSEEGVRRNDQARGDYKKDRVKIKGGCIE